MRSPYEIPEQQWAVAITCGHLVAKGILELPDIVQQLVKAAVANGYRGDGPALQCRLTWRVREAADACRILRREMYWEIRRRLPELFRVETDLLEVVRAAHRVNEGADAPLLRYEVEDLVCSELERCVRNASRTRRYV